MLSPSKSILSTALPTIGILVAFAIIDRFGNVFFRSFTNHIGRAMAWNFTLPLIFLSQDGHLLIVLRISIIDDNPYDSPAG